MLLFIIRHGDPIYDPDSLTELGHRQAEALGERMALHGLQRVFVSPMVRARQTAEPTCRRLGLGWTVEDWMSEATAWDEMSDLDADGQRRWLFLRPNIVFNTQEVKELGDRWYEAACFQSRDMKSAYARITDASDAFLARLGYVREGRRYRIVEPNEERVACFCHQGFGTTWLSWLLGIQPPAFWGSFNITHSGVTLLQFENRPEGYTAPQCLCLSDSSHIYAAGLPYLFSNSLEL